MAARRVTAASALLLSLGMGATVVLTAVPVLSASASAYDPPVDPCDAGETCESTPEVTITVTTTLDTPTPTDPVTTITKTVTPTPTTTPTPTPTPTPTQQPTVTQNPQPIATPPVTVPSATAVATTPEPAVVMPTVSETPTPVDTGVTTEPVQLEMHKAQDEFDQKSLTQKLSIPALILVLLALFAVLIFEGRLRRMAHAAAVRKAGPGRPGDPGYPAGPGYATAAMPAPGYPGGTAYAPIISFVPVQTYPTGPVQYGTYQQPDPYAQMPQPDPYAHHQAPPDPIVLHPDEFYSEPESPSEYRDPFEPLVPPTEVPESEIPYGGAAPYEESHETPHASALGAEPGDEEPWAEGQSEDHDGTAIFPMRLPEETTPTLEAPRPPKRTIWRRDP